MAYSAYDYYHAEMQTRFSKGELNEPAPLIASALQKHADFVKLAAHKPGTLLVFNKEDEFGLLPNSMQNEWTKGLTAGEFQNAQNMFECIEKHALSEGNPLGKLVYTHTANDSSLTCETHCLYHQVEITAYEPGDFAPDPGLCMDMGTGKSKVLLDNVGLLYEIFVGSWRVFREKTVWEAPGGPYSSASSEWWWFVPPSK